MLPIAGAHPEGPRVSAARIQAGMDTVVGQGGSWPQGDLDHRLGYARDHTTVDLDPPAKGGRTYDGNEDLAVHVRHDFYLSIPYAARVLATLSPDGMTLDFGRNQFAIVMHSWCMLTNEGDQDWVDVEHFPVPR